MRKPVTTGQALGADTVVQGLQEGDLVVVDGIQQLRPGAQVDARIVSDPASGPAVENDGPSASGDHAGATPPAAPKRLSSGT